MIVAASTALPLRAVFWVEATIVLTTTYVVMAAYRAALPRPVKAIGLALVTFVLLMVGSTLVNHVTGTPPPPGLAVIVVGGAVLAMASVTLVVYLLRHGGGDGGPPPPTN